MQNGTHRSSLGDEFESYLERRKKQAMQSIHRNIEFMEPMEGSLTETKMLYMRQRFRTFLNAQPDSLKPGTWEDQFLGKSEFGIPTHEQPSGLKHFAAIYEFLRDELDTFLKPLPLLTALEQSEETL